MSLGVPELLILLAIVLLVLGPRRLPAIGRQLGNGLRSLREAVGSGAAGPDDDEDDDEDRTRGELPAG